MGHSVAYRRLRATRQLFLGCLASLALTFLTAETTHADEPFQVEVNILSAPVKSGEQTIANVPRETKLTAHEFNGSHYLVDVPNTNPLQQGWIAKDDVHRVVDPAAEYKRRLAAATPEGRGQLKAELIRLAALEKLFNQLDAQRRSRESVAVGRQIADGTAALLGMHSNATADKFAILGNRLKESGDYAAAREYHEQALAIHREIFGEKHASTAGSLDNLGVVAKVMGDYAAARRYHEQALAIYRETLGEKHADTAGSLNNLGAVAQGMGDYTAARRYHEQALAIRREILGEKHASTADSLNNLGTIAEEAGDYPAARKYHEQALAIRREALGEKHASTANSLNNLGNVAWRVGDYAAARKYYEQALAIYREVLGENHDATAASLNNLGLVAADIGDFAAARRHHEEALAIFRQLFGEKHTSTANSLNNLGAVAIGMADYAAARRYFAQALAIQREVLGEKHASTAGSLNNLGVVATEIGDYAAARRYHEQALAIYREVLGEKHADTAASLTGLGVAAGNMGDYAAARNYFKQALAIHREVLGENHPATARSYIDLSLADAGDGQWAAATADMRDARRSTRRHVARVLPALSAKEQLRFLDNTDLMQLHESLSLGLAGRADASLAAASGGWVLNGKAVAEETLSEQNRLDREATEPAAHEAWEKLKAIRGQLAAMSTKTPPTNQGDIWRKQITDLESQEQTLVRALATFGTKIELRDPWFSVDDVRGKLAADALLVDIARFDLFDFQAKGKEKHWKPAHYAAWLIPPAGKGGIQIVDLGEADKIEAVVKAARAAIENTGDRQQLQEHGEHESEKQLQQPLRALAALVLDPILAKAGDAKRLILSPDGALWLVPFAALPMSDGRYAIEKYQIDYVVSGRDLLAHDSAAPGKLSAPLIFADPDFDLSPQEQLAQTRELLHQPAEQQSPAPVDALAMRSAESFTRGGRVERLRGTADEARAVAPSLKLYAHEEPRLFTGKQALEGVFKAAKRPQVVVFATHGFFLPDQEAKLDDRDLSGSDRHGTALTTDGKPLENPLLRCGLLLAGCNHRGEATSDDDGVLTGLEIVGTDLRGTELVVLSACQTGLGDVHNGQGVAGLRQAFQLAGAKAVVSTLWEIPDLASARLMSQFFEDLSAGQSKGAALRQAQLATIAARRAKYGAAHPLFWAAYTLTGE